MHKETIEEFMARGGSVTELPAKGYSRKGLNSQMVRSGVVERISNLPMDLSDSELLRYMKLFHKMADLTGGYEVGLLIEKYGERAKTVWEDVFNRIVAEKSIGTYSKSRSKRDLAINHNSRK
jgi:hypothetical protein